MPNMGEIMSWCSDMCFSLILVNVSSYNILLLMKKDKFLVKYLIKHSRYLCTQNGSPPGVDVIKCVTKMKTVNAVSWQTNLLLPAYK